jgi:hypothetical protein
MTTTSSPVAPKLTDAEAKAAAASGISTGNATKFWLELVSLPAGNNNRLWLLVNNAWTHLTNTSAGLQASVQNAFNAGSNLQVAVWYDGSLNIVGLVVRTP